jgi:hypothetical protein
MASEALQKAGSSILNPSPKQRYAVSMLSLQLEPQHSREKTRQETIEAKNESRRKYKPQTSRRAVSPFCLVLLCLSTNQPMRPVSGSSDSCRWSYSTRFICFFESTVVVRGTNRLSCEIACLRSPRIGLSLDDCFCFCFAGKK